MQKKIKFLTNKKLSFGESRNNFVQNYVKSNIEFLKFVSMEKKLIIESSSGEIVSQAFFFST